MLAYQHNTSKQKQTPGLGQVFLRKNLFWKPFSPSVSLDLRRYRIDIDTFRKEHRLRRFLVSGAPIHTQDGRKLRESRMQKLITRYDDFLAQEVPQERGNAQ